MNIQGILTSTILFFGNPLRRIFSVEIYATKKELSQIQYFIEIVRPKKIDEGAALLLRQLEQRKIPYLKEISVEELDWLLDKGVDLEGILDIVLAKGGKAKGLASIKWNGKEKGYKEESKRTLYIKCFVISLLISMMIYVIYNYIEFNVFAGDYKKQVSFILYLVTPLLAIFSVDNNITSKERLIKKYAYIFSSNKSA
ncbi:MAG: hypothetical protein Q4A74_04635 [Cardiobacteriaceae bacterium]|nr:hypothetical protein [Cardiobacteriaceae bacterium]